MTDTLVIKTRTQGEVSGDDSTSTPLNALVRDKKIVHDQSRIPDQGNRSGYAVMIWDFEVHGGANGDKINIGPVLPKGTAVIGGYAQVITAVADGTAATSVKFNLAGDEDIKAAATTLATPGFVAIKPPGAALADAILLSEDKQVELEFGAVATAGVVLIYLELSYGQPAAS